MTRYYCRNIAITQVTRLLLNLGFLCLQSGTRECYDVAMPRPTKTADGLRKAAQHVGYEISMLAYSATFLGCWRGSPPWPYGSEANMALESILLHFRNLRAFLCPSLQATGSNDILAGDFLKPVSGTDVGDTISLGVDKTRLDRMLAHLSYCRDDYIEASDYMWNIGSLSIVMLEQLSRFVMILPQDRRDWFPSAEQINEYRTEVQSRFLR